MKKIIVGLVVFTCACTAATKVTKPSTELLPAMQQKVPGITLARAEQGYTAYKQNCTECHRLHAASEYTTAQWDAILVKMFPKAKVHDEATQGLITDYLHALSK